LALAAAVLTVGEDWVSVGRQHDGGGAGIETRSAKRLMQKTTCLVETFYRTAGQVPTKFTAVSRVASFKVRLLSLAFASRSTLHKILTIVAFIRIFVAFNQATTEAEAS